MTNATPADSAAGLPLVAHALSIGGRNVQILAMTDEDAVLALGADRDPFPFGLLLWESAVGLAVAVSLRRADLAGRRVLELGCGVGLVGQVAAMSGAHVVATDHDPLVLDVARANATANLSVPAGADCGSLTFQLADWSDWRQADRYDVVLGADIVYDRAAHTSVLAVLARTLAEGGEAILADPGRHEQAAFLAAAADAGFDVGLARIAVPDLRRAGVMAEIAIITLRRRTHRDSQLSDAETTQIPV
jgi:predicted nicotinamide N-methyase